MKDTIEIEHRALITEQDFLRLRKDLPENAEVLGEDNKDTFFYIWPDKVIKVVDNKSIGKAKISLKPGRIGKQSHFHETELTVMPDEVGLAKRFCEALDPEKIMQAYQFRTNYLYKGVEIALKYTQSWGFHMEFEIMIDDVAKRDAADAAIRAVAEELGASLMGDEELADFTASIEGGKNYGIYSDETFPY